MKKHYTLLLLIVFTLLFTACNKADEEPVADPEPEEEIEVEIVWTEGTYKYFDFKYPQDWRTKSTGDNFYLYPTENNEDAMIMLTFHEIKIIDEKEDLESFSSGLQKSDAISDFSENEITINDAYGRQASYVQQIEDITLNVTTYYWNVDDQGIMVVSYGVNVNNPEDYLDICLDIINSMEYEIIIEKEPEEEPEEENVPEEAAEPKEETAAEEEASSSPTMSQRNALSKARDYLKISAFSYTGLIGQLEFEGYPTEDATYAADNCGADWNQQAAQKAQAYLDLTAFSRSGLIDQLLFEGFTTEQAEYGASAVGY